MPAIADAKCECDTCAKPLERVRFFPRQLLTADDMRAEQEYFRERVRRHNRYLHGWGVVCGCTIEPIGPEKQFNVRVCPGYVIGPQGDDIWIDNCVEVDIRTGAQDPPCAVRWPCPPVGYVADVRDGTLSVYIAVRYAECFSHPVRVHPAGCGCDETGCEYSRTRDSFEIKVLRELPKSHVDARQDDNQWCTTITNAPPEWFSRLHLFPVPPCPECVDEPWVVLASVTVQLGDSAPGVPPNPPQISYMFRRVLLATQRLQTAMLCLP